jgi:catechol 2,3-dioxygenase-like lactoylglutathione lyase family enzyme
MAGIPTARGVDHVGYTVPDLQQAVDFFVDLLGGEVVFYAGPFSDPDGDWMTTNLDVDRNASLRFAMIRLGADTCVELFQYASPDQSPVPPRNSDAGGRHIAIYVDDIEAAVAYLRAAPGVQVLGEPTLNVPPSPNAGSTFVYFRSPWGMYFELFSAPDGMAYETQTAARLKPTPRRWTNRTDDDPAPERAPVPSPAP